MSYTPTEWKSGDVITSENLNKLEQGVAAAGGGGGGGVLVVGADMDTMTLDKTWKEIADAPFAIIKTPMSEYANGYILIFETEEYNGTYSVSCAAFDVDSQGVVSLGQLIFETNSENGYPVLQQG